MQEKKQRKSNIELLRCILMYMVIILHYNNPDMGGALANASGINEVFLHFLEAASVCAVNCFVLISAFFLSRTTERSIRKPLQLLAMVSGYKILFYLLSVVLGVEPFQLFSLVWNVIPANWFVVLFSVLYVITPYINPLFEVLSQKQLQRFLLLLIILFVLYPTIVEIGMELVTGSTQCVGLGTVTVTGSSEGYTIVNFLLIYLIGGYLNRYPLSFSTGKYCAGFLCCVLLDFLLSFISQVYTSYSNIFVFFAAIFLFLVFWSWDIGSHRWINEISKSTFGIFIIHTCSFMLFHFWGYFRIAEYAKASFGVMVLHAWISVSAMFVICFVIDYICRKAITPIVSVIEKRIWKRKDAD